MLSERPWIDRIVRESEFIDQRLFREYYEHLARGYARGVRAAQIAREVDARYDPEVIAFAYTGIGNFVGMRWADWTAGGRVPDDVLDDVLELLGRGLAPQDSGLSARGGAACPARPGSNRMAAAAMQLQRHGCGSHAVGLRQEVVPGWREGLLRPAARPAPRDPASDPGIAEFAPTRRPARHIRLRGSAA
jgi:hypothetical protein